MKAGRKFVSDENSYGLRMEEHPEVKGIILRVEKAESPPPKLGLLIGECVHQYRSALDHLAFQLLIANTKGRIPARVVKRSEFPIFNSGPKFRGKRNRKGKLSSGSGRAKIEGIDPRAQAVIEWLQPYHRRKNPRALSLWQLQELANIDKHRLLHLSRSALQGSPMMGVKARNVAEVRGGFIPGPFKRNAIVGEFEVVPIDPRYPFEMHMQPELLTDVAFSKASPARSVRGLSVVLTLYLIGQFIASDVLPPLTEILDLQSSFDPGRLVHTAELSPSERETVGGFSEDLRIA